MIQHDPNVLQIPSKLHLHDKVHSTPHAIYRHLENESQKNVYVGIKNIQSAMNNFNNLTNNI
jgi:hypothetical protein